MKNLMKIGYMATLMGAMVFFTGCDDNEIIVPDPTSEYDGELEITEGNTSSLTIFTTDLAEDATEVKALVTVTADADKMKRIYITQNIAGTGEEPFELTGTDNKLDGSLDLENSAANEFAFELRLPLAGGITEGTVVYNIWATSGRGDYRDSSKRLLAGVGTLTVNYGGNNPETDVKAFSTKILAAPLASGTSESFISLLDGQLYTINQGQEYAAFWDFGYYWGAVGASAGQEASLASTSAYEDAFTDSNSVGIVDIDGISGTTELNNCSFKKSTTFNSDDFDSIVKASDLNSVSASSQTINNLVAGDIIEFIDNYGKKGLIRVVEVVGTYNQNDYIKIDIKVQP